MATTSSEPCQICGGTEMTALVRQDGFDWVRCADCGFACLAPMPGAAEAGAIQSPAVAHAYIDDLLAKVDSKMRRSRRRVRQLKRRMRGPNMLDVGSNIGCFVEAGRETGLDAWGIDINADLVAFAAERYPGNHFVAGALEQADFNGRRFDGIYTSEVIEHAIDANAFLAGVSRLLNPGGVLYLTTPDLREYRRGGRSARSGGGWSNLGAPDHKLYFMPENMRRMLAKHGFSGVRFRFNPGRGIKVFARKA